MLFLSLSLSVILSGGALAFPSSNVFANTLDKRVLTQDNTCGGANGYTCNPSIANGGPCCSANGYCGKTSAYCNAGCQWDFSNTGCNYTSVNTCGGSNGYTCNPNSPNGGACCSASGYCGSSSAYCSVASGCQSSFGKCYGRSAPASQNGAGWTVGNIGTFTKRSIFNFTSLSALPSGLVASNYPTNDLGTIATAKYNKTFVPSLVTVSGGFLNLKVTGGQNKSPIQCSEVITCQENILYGSFRVVAMMANANGVCNGNFYYQEPYVNHNQELDYEFLTDASSTSNTDANNNHNNPSGTKNLFYTNYGSDGSKFPVNVVAPSDAQTALHEYRVDWLPGKSIFYIDGVQTSVITTDVPNVPGSWILNNWSNGDPNWSVGPPTADAIFKIQSLVMYWNSSGTTQQQNCNILIN